MQLCLDSNQARYQIEGFEGSVVKINSVAYTTSLIISPTHFQPEWSVRSPQDLNSASLKPLFDLEPNIVLLGTGASCTFPDQKILYLFLERKIGIEVMSTAAAIRTYVVLSSEGRKVAAALIL